MRPTYSPGRDLGEPPVGGRSEATVPNGGGCSLPALAAGDLEPEGLYLV